ncbi:MAG: lytic transglycosylase domain-containing protein [Aliishimia sp.]
MNTTRVFALAAGLALATPLGLIAPLTGLASGVAQADSPKPFPNFEAKRLKPPKRNSGKKRILVQIEPEAPAPVAQARAAPGADDAPSKPGAYAWFWEKVSPELASASAGRVETALDAISGSSAKVRAPRLQALQDIAKLRGVDILTSTIGTDVSPALVLAVIAVESAGKDDAQSHAGAQGLMQLMPATAQRFGVTDSFSAQQNIKGGVKYLDWLMKEFNGDPILALAGYNAGEGSVRKNDGVPPFAETRDYVPKVLAAFQVAKGLCITPPQLASDGCVFAAMN